MAFGVLGAEGLEGADVVGGVAAHVCDADGETVAHADDAELGDGVLFEELGDEILGVAEGEQVAGGEEVFLGHGGGEVDDEDEVADDASLEGGGVFEQSKGGYVSASGSLNITVLFCTGHCVGCETHRFLLPASKSPSTVELIVPSAPSTTFSHVRVTSHPCCPLRTPCPEALVPGPAPRVT